MNSKRYKTIRLTPDMISALASHELQIPMQEISSERSLWKWVLRVANGSVVCECWPVNEAELREDSSLAWEAPRFRGFGEPIRVPAIPGAVLRLFDTKCKIRYYGPEKVSMLRASGAEKVFDGIPAEYRGLEIKLPNNRVHADVYVYLHGEWKKLEREDGRYGYYTLPIPAETEVMIVRYHNRQRRTDTVACHYRSSVRFWQLVKEISEKIAEITK